MNRLLLRNDKVSIEVQEGSDIICVKQGATSIYLTAPAATLPDNSLYELEGIVRDNRQMSLLEELEA